jgi:hypothetical protein
MSEVPVPATEAQPVDGQSVERVLEGESLALSVLMLMRAVTRFLDRVYQGIGYICGGMLLMLGLFITYQVVARKLGWVMAPGHNLMSGFVLAMATTWAFSYALRRKSSWWTSRPSPLCLDVRTPRPFNGRAFHPKTHRPEDRERTGGRSGGEAVVQGHFPPRLRSA